MLKARVITAILLLAVIVPCLFFASPLEWSVLATLFVALGAWEWGRLSGFSEKSARSLGVFSLIMLSLVVHFFPEYVLFDIARATTETITLSTIFPYVVSSAFWLCVVPFWLKKHWRVSGSLLCIPVGVVVLIPTWLAIIQLRFFSAPVLIALLAIVWLADIAAYFSGKLFGKHKLAISISPGKTWEGAIGAAFFVSAYGLFLANFFWHVSFSSLLVIAGMLLITAISIIGDLFESLLKRQVGLKDSSHVLPGHGGVLDRIDSLTSVLPFMAFAWLLFVKVF